MQDRQRARKVGYFAIVALLHVVIGWLLLANDRLGRFREPVEATTLVLLTLPSPPARSADTPSRLILQDRAAPKRPSSAAQQRAPARTSAADGAVTHAAPSSSGAAIDWNAELAAAARDSAADTRTPQRDFGFPGRPSKPPAAHEFGWDYAHTHRVESLEGGGILVHLNDQCVLLLFPLPFAACGIGKKPANGELFKDLHGDAAKPAP